MKPEEILRKWRDLAAKYMWLRMQMLDVRVQMQKLPGMARHRPDAKMQVCPCGAGPMTAQEFHNHLCLIKTGRGRYLRSTHGTEENPDLRIRRKA